MFSLNDILSILNKSGIVGNYTILIADEISKRCHCNDWSYSGKNIVLKYIVLEIM